MTPRRHNVKLLSILENKLSEILGSTCCAVVVAYSVPLHDLIQWSKYMGNEDIKVRKS